MDFELKGKKAIVSAGGSGIGYTLLKNLLSKVFQSPHVILMKTVFKNCVINILKYTQRSLMLAMNGLSKNFA